MDNYSVSLLTYIVLSIFFIGQIRRNLYICKVKRLRLFRLWRLKRRLKGHNKQKNHICGNHETPKAGAKHELCWTPKSVSSSITNCDKNHISGNHKFGVYQKQELSWNFCSTIWIIKSSFKIMFKFIYTDLVMLKFKHKKVF